jgi:hypothetical protein
MYNCTSTLHNTVIGLYPVPVDHVISIGNNGKIFKLHVFYGYESRWRANYINVMHMHSTTYTHVDMINWASSLNTATTWKNDDFGWKCQILKWYNFGMKWVVDNIITWCCRAVKVD